MTAQQLVLSLVLAVMVFSVALELRVEDFRRVARMPRGVISGLIPQFLLLPVGTWCATLLLDLTPATEAAMILVAACPGGSLSNVITHYGRGNTALSVSISAVASLLALVLTPLHFGWMITANPVTSSWLRQLEIDPSDIWISLVLALVVPMSTGLLLGHKDCRAVMLEGGMQNSGLALGIIAVQFNAELGMVIVASLWGIWHIVSGLTLATLWRWKDARSIG